MTLAHAADLPRSTGPIAAAIRANAARAAATANGAPPVQAVPEGPQARGFVLYVGLGEEKAAADGTSLGTLVAELRRVVAELAPSSESYAAVALAPRDAGGRDIDVVRLALHEPTAFAQHHDEPAAEEAPSVGVVVDLSRKRVQLDGETAPLTFKEFELLQYLVLREGRTIERSELVAGLWSETDEDAPSERTVDVHVRRLRSKLGAYDSIVRTVRGAGYRFDRHADVSIRHTTAPSPDIF